MEKLNFPVPLAGGLAVLGCQLPADDGEYYGGPVQDQLTVTASPSDGGTITRSSDQIQYAPDTCVTLTTNPAFGYHFARWEGEATGSTNPTTTPMNGRKTVTAVFTLQLHWNGRLTRL
jgi:hypothetical protein